jgi:uncharacterized protein YbjT (DUF2867 family)
MADQKTILVCGATGRQGGAVARALLNGDACSSGDWKVRALTRDPGSAAAQALAVRGAELVEGDMDDRAALDRALASAWGVFSVQNFWTSSYDEEIQQGKNVGDAAQAAGVGHVVYSSVGGADRQSGLAHFESKWIVEEYLRELGVPLTIFRPVFFMDNLLAEPGRSAILAGTVSLALEEGATLQMIAVSDIGAFVALAFADPDKWLGQAVEIAGDELTGPQIAESFTEVLGQDVRWVELPMDQLRAANEEYAEMFEWFNRAGYTADLRRLREIYPGLLNLPAWLRETGWSAFAPQ